MKTLPILFGLTLVSITACRKTQSDTNQQTAESPTKLADELRSLELEEKRLKHEIEIERLALEKERLSQERNELNQSNDQLQDDILALEKERMRLDADRSRDAAETARMAEIEKKLAAEKSRLQKLQQAPPQRPLPSRSLQPMNNANVEYDFSVFHSRLSPHGSWFSIPQYGYVWRPSCWNQNNWHPYTLGHWIYSDCGWTWVSTEPFGWATYHYGRWILLKNTGWCWIPGSTWGPAWVCWRNNSSHIGWAPLPPESLHWRENEWTSYYGDSCGLNSNSFCFVKTSHFGGNILSFIISRPECDQAYRKTNYCGGYLFENRRVICRAVDYDVACRWIGQTIPRYQCEFNTTLPNGLDPLRHVARRGNRLQIHAPDFQAPWNQALRPTRLEREIINDSAIRSHTFNNSLQARFIESRDKERQIASRVANDELSQKMMRRIGLREKIALQREELSSAIQQTSASQNQNMRSIPTDQIVTPMNQGLRNQQEPKNEQIQQTSEPILAQENNLTATTESMVNEQTAKQSDQNTHTNDQLQQGGGLREIQSKGANGKRTQETATIPRNDEFDTNRRIDPITQRIKENQQRALRQQQTREQELAESANKRTEEEKLRSLAALAAREQKEQAEDMAKTTSIKQQQEQAERMRQQQEQEQAERMRQQQEQEQAERMRQQQEQEQAERMRQQQEQEQGERMRQQQEQEQGERMRQQQEQEQAERMRQQQEQEQAERMRQQQEQEQAERMRQQQEQEQAERMRQQQEQEQAERMRQQQEQEQAERMRQQQEQEQAERMRQQQEQEQAERMRQQQEAARERQEQAERMREQQEAARERQEQAERMREQQEAARERQEQAERLRQQSGQ